MKKIILNATYFIFIGLFLILFYVFFIFNPNNYKDQIINYVSSITKYDFTYNGEIQMVFFPNTKIIMPNIEIYKASPDSKNMMMTISKTELSVSLRKLMDDIVDVNYLRASDFKYYGINADDVLMKTYSLLKFSFFKTDHPNTTTVKKMSGKANISGDTMKVNDIYMETEMMEAKGSGTIDMITKRVDFKMVGNLKDSENIVSSYRNNYPEELVGEELPIIISGELNNLSISIDLKHIIIKKVTPIKEKAIETIKEKVIDDIKDKIKLPF